MCVVCQLEIEAERAEALPETRLCIEHAREIQKYGGEFTLTGTLESTSKVGSLKKNYGGVDVVKCRNAAGLLQVMNDFDKKEDKMNGH